jgi:hypothetical protein
MHRKHDYRYQTRPDVFDQRTRECVDQWECERRQRFLEILASDPIQELHEELAIGEILRLTAGGKP